MRGMYCSTQHAALDANAWGFQGAGTGQELKVKTAQGDELRAEPPCKQGPVHVKTLERHHLSKH